MYKSNDRETLLKIREIFTDDRITNWEKREKSKNMIDKNESFDEDEKEKYFNHIDQLYNKMIRSGIFSLIM